MGYDVCARLLLALDNIHLLKTGHHAGAKGGLFGCAAAVGALLRLDARQMRHVLSYCAQQASGLYTMHRDTEHIQKAYVIGGMPAHQGVLAATLAAHGFTGLDDVFSGERNFISTYAIDPDPDELARDLGKRFVKQYL